MRSVPGPSGAQPACPDLFWRQDGGGLPRLFNFRGILIDHDLIHNCDDASEPADEGLSRLGKFFRWHFTRERNDPVIICGIDLVIREAGILYQLKFHNFLQSWILVHEFSPLCEIRSSYSIAFAQHNHHVSVYTRWIHIRVYTSLPVH